MEAYMSTPECKQNNKQPDIVLDSEWMSRYRQPMLYHWKRNGESMYIGQTRDGISRPASHTHEVLRHFADGDVLELHLMGKEISIRDLFTIEQAMIDQYKPAMNRSQTTLPPEPQMTYREWAARFQAQIQAHPKLLDRVDRLNRYPLSNIVLEILGLDPVTHRENMRRAPARRDRRASALDHRAAGLARTAALTPERRSEIARLGARARWAKAIR
jgi:hypothetical protein